MQEDTRKVKKLKGKYLSQKINNLKIEGRTLFDVAQCKCKIVSQCSCARSKKVPEIERPFLTDQRTERKLYIGRVDKEESCRVSLISDRKQKREKYYEEERSKLNRNEIDDLNSNSESEIASDENESDYISCTTSRNNTELTQLAKVCERYGVSNTAAAAIATATLMDYGIVTENDKSQVIDSKKVWRSREKIRNKLRSSLTNINLKGIFFDGKKDATLQSNHKLIEEEHVTVIQEPKSKYLCHAAPSKSNAQEIFQSILQSLTEKEIEYDEIVAIGCDGTNVNTGIKGGVIRKMEEHVGHALQWCICLLHFNELPFRHIFIHFDGKTSGPNLLNGPIGKMLNNCVELPPVQFCKISNSVAELKIDYNQLSKDQRYLYEICCSINAGFLPSDLEKREPGPIFHSRWLTTANRVLRLYCSSDSPSKNHILLVKYILHVYAPMWFQIKIKPKCFDGSKHLWKIIHLARNVDFDDKARAVFESSVQRNAFYAHPENIILAMLMDDEPNIRKNAVDKVKFCRINSSATLRSFKVPQVNFFASSYLELSDMSNSVVSEPPIVRHIQTDHLENLWCDLKFQKQFGFPCHNQAVERHVKITSEAASSVIGNQRRDGYILAKLDSIQTMPSFDSKQNWNA